MTQAVCAFPEDAGPARRLAAALAVPFLPLSLHVFPDGESRPLAPPSPNDVAVYRNLHRPDGKIMSLLLAADALRRAGGRTLTLVAPYMPYMRQDQVFEPGQPVSRDVLGRLLGEAFDRIVTVQAHLHRTASLGPVFGKARADNLLAMEAFAGLSWPKKPLLVAPDAESMGWVADLAGRVHGDVLRLTKVRSGDADVRVSAADAARAFRREAVIFDDIVSTGGTACQAARLLKAAGATSVSLCVVHALFAPEVLARLEEAGIDTIVSSDSIPHPTNAVTLTRLIARELRGA